MSSSTPPGDYPAHQLGTLFLRVPFVDWNRVKIGEKREFRTKPRGNAHIHKAICPTPVVAYTVSTNGAKACKLMVLEEQRVERLIDVAVESERLELEGIDSYNEFKRYWRKRNGGIYKPLDKVLVHRVSPWRDPADMALALMDRLYGEYYPRVTEFSEHASL